MQAADARRVAHSGRTGIRGGRDAEGGPLRSDDRRERAGSLRRNLDRRPDAAEQDARSRHALRAGRDGSDRAKRAPGHARRAREHDVSRDHARGHAAQARGARPNGWRGCVPRVQPGACGSWKPEVPHEEHAEGRRRDDCRVHRGRRRALLVVHRQPRLRSW